MSASTVVMMFCPRCGTVAAGEPVKCTRCGAFLARPENPAAEPPIPRAPTYRGEMAQRAAGVVTQVLAKPRPAVETPAHTPAAAVPHPPPPAPAAPAPQGGSGGEPVAPPAPAGGSGSSWPPPPATWEPTAPGGWSAQSGPGPAGSPARAPAPAWPPPQGPGWASPTQPGWAPPRSGWSASASSWRDRLLGTVPVGVAPPSYFWQSLVCLFLFLPTALAAVTYSIQVTRRVQAGDATGAIRASRLARAWCLASLAAFAGLVIATLAGAPI